MEIPGCKHVLSECCGVLMVPVIAPVSLACPVLRKNVVQATVWTEVFGIERGRRRVGIEQYGAAARAGQICAQARCQPVPGFPHGIETAVMRLVGISGKLLHEYRRAWAECQICRRRAAHVAD